MVIMSSQHHVARWQTRMLRWMSLAVLLLGATIVFGKGLALFEQPMSAKTKAQYLARLKDMPIEQLGIELEKERSIQRIKLLVAELSSRGQGAMPVLERYREAREAKDPASRMVLAKVHIAIARIRYADADKAYLAALEKMLTDGDSHMVDATARELGRIGSTEAVAVLKSHEKEGRSWIKIARLQAQYGKLPPEGRTAAILESARATIRGHQGDRVPALVAEGSLLAWLGESAEPHLKKELEKLAARPSDLVDRQYRAFVERVLEDLQRARVMKRTPRTMPVATWPTSTPTSTVSTSPALTDAVVPSKPESAADGEVDTAPGAQANQVAEPSTSSVQWLVAMGAGVAVVVAACVMGIRVQKRRRRKGIEG